MIDRSALWLFDKKTEELDAAQLASQLAAYAPLVARAHRAARNSYEACDPRTRGRVEIELVDPGSSTRSQHRHAWKRARWLTELSVHPNISHVRDLLELPGGRLGLVVAHRSWSLSDGMSRGWTATPAQAVNIGLSISSALAVLHCAGMSHLALCPENIMVRPGGNVEVAGFASLVSGEVAFAPLSEGADLVRHAAPEVLEGFASGPPADVYSLGSVIYNVLSGRAPFEVLPGESAAAFALRVLAEQAAPLRGGIPDDLRSFVGSAIAKNPSLRPSSPAQCSAALDEIRECHGWTEEDLRLPGEQHFRPDTERENGDDATGIEAFRLIVEEDPSHADATPSAKDRNTIETSRPRRSRRALETPLADNPRVESFPAATRGQPQVPLKGPDEPLESLEPLKSARPHRQEMPVSPSDPGWAVSPDGDGARLAASAARHVGVGARWGRVSGARRAVAGARRSGTGGGAPAQASNKPSVLREPATGMGTTGGTHGPVHLPLVVKAFVVVAAMVIAVAALVALGVL